MLSLSTSWNSHRHAAGGDIIKEIAAAGFDTVELNFALTENVVEEILSLKERGSVKVSSLHNICPLPPEVAPERASPDYYSLSSSDEAERKAAIKAAKNTLIYAKRFDAGAVVLHAGKVPIKDRTRDLAAMREDRKRFEPFREEMVRQRREQSKTAFDNVVRSLEELVSFAKGLGVAMGVENRYYYSEIPVMDELEELFRLFKPGELYYWHDVGHAEVFDRLGLTSHAELLKRFSDRLIGMHLHDIIGPVTDHRPPGSGTFDFSIVKPYIKPGTALVMEVHEPATAEEIRIGADYLKKVLGLQVR
jgi:sugar phosphate isomerase/epimerase